MDSHMNICSLINKLNINDDSIVMNRKIKDLCTAQDFQSVTQEDHMLREAFISFNNRALIDEKFGVNLAFVFSSRSFDSYVENGSFVRAEMLNTLQKNYMNADNLRNENIKKFYNSITLLGEYYNRCRINNGPVSVLGCALFELLLKQLELDTGKSIKDSSHVIDEEFAKLVLTQVALNGLLAQPTHKTEIDSLLFAVRKCLIDVSNLSSNVKAFFLMTLDLYYSKFLNIGKDLETMYSKFLMDDKNRTKDIHTEASKLNPGISSENDINNFSKSGSELSGLTSGKSKQDVRINNEYIGRPLKASERLKFAQQQAALQKNKSETEEILQEKLFEKKMLERNNENLNIIEKETPRDVQPPELIDPPQLPPVNESVVTTKSKSAKGRKEDQAYFLVKPLIVRQRLKVSEQPQPVGLIDWYDEVENSANKQISPNSVNNESTKKTHNGYLSNSSDPTSPQEIRRGNFMNSSFRSIRSDYSTRSMDRVGNPRYDQRAFDNKRHNHNRGHFNQNNSGNYNNYNNNYQNNYQQGQSQHQNHVFRRQNSDNKGQNYSNKTNDNREGSTRGGCNSQNYQPNRSYPSKSYGNRNRRQSYQHDDRCENPKPRAGEKWEEASIN